MPDMDPVESVLASLAAWTAEKRADEAAEGRQRERWLRQMVAESATLVGTLIDLAESKARISVALTGGQAVHGQAVAVGQDFVAIRSEGGATLVVALARLKRVWTQSETGGGGDRPPTLELAMADFLLQLSHERSLVALVVGGEPVVGRLTAVGQDVAMLVTGEPAITVLVPLEQIDLVRSA